MSPLSNADVYASLGVQGVVASAEDHDQAMLELNVPARDGDDSLELGNNDVEEEVEVNPSNEELEDNASPEAISLGDIPEEVKAVTQDIAEHEEGFQEMVNQAIERGLPEDAILRIQEEYSGEGLSKRSYDELAKAGFSKGFVDSYIKGQEALVDKYVRSVMEYAGGTQQFQDLYAYLEANDPDAAGAIINALEARDITTVKAIVNLASSSRAKHYGKKAARSVATKGTPPAPITNPASIGTKGYASTAEIIKAMSDPRYRQDAAFRAEVERKTALTNF